MGPNRGSGSNLLPTRDPEAGYQNLLQNPNSPIHLTDSVLRWNPSKYPPAEPEALGVAGPLKGGPSRDPKSKPPASSVHADGYDVRTEKHTAGTVKL